MERLKEKIRESVPTLAVFQYAGNQDAVEVKYLIEQLRKNLAGKAEVVRVDASFDGNLKEEYNLKEYPTYILFKEGQELMRESGKKTLAELSDMVQSAL